jgi:hypothetical protein
MTSYLFIVLVPCYLWNHLSTKCTRDEEGIILHRQGDGGGERLEAEVGQLGLKFQGYVSEGQEGGVFTLLRLDHIRYVPVEGGGVY